MNRSLVDLQQLFSQLVAYRGWRIAAFGQPPGLRADFSAPVEVLLQLVENSRGFASMCHGNRDTSSACLPLHHFIAMMNDRQPTGQGFQDGDRKGFRE